MQTLSYIGPAQVTEGATLQSAFYERESERCRVGPGVDGARLKEFATQNLLALFYVLNLFRSEDKPRLEVWTASDNHIREGAQFHGLARQPESGDVEILFSMGRDNSSPSLNLSAMLSDIKLVRVFGGFDLPGYVAEALGMNAGGGRQEGDTPLRHPRTGKTLLPVAHPAFYEYARGHAEMPEPFTVAEAGRIVLGAPAARAA